MQAVVIPQYWQILPLRGGRSRQSKTKTKRQATGSQRWPKRIRFEVVSSLKLFCGLILPRNCYLVRTSRPRTLLPCLPSPCFLQQRFPYPPPPPPAFAFGRHASGLRGALSSFFGLYVLTVNRSTASRTPRYHVPAFFAAWIHCTVSTPTCHGESCVEPSV